MGRLREASTQRQCPGSCHHAGKTLTVRQRESAKHKDFTEVKVHTQIGREK